MKMKEIGSRVGRGVGVEVIPGPLLDPPMWVVHLCAPFRCGVVEYHENENVTPEMNFISLFPSATDISGSGNPCNVSTNGLKHVQQPGQISYAGGSTLQVLCEPGWQYSNNPLDVQRQYTCNSGMWSNNFADCIRNLLFL